PRPPASLSCSVPAPPPPEPSPLSLHDALPILRSTGEIDEVDARGASRPDQVGKDRDGVARLDQADVSLQVGGLEPNVGLEAGGSDRKSTRLNSSHVKISYAGFCLKKKIHTETR